MMINNKGEDYKMESTQIKPPVEVRYQEELEALK